MSSVVRQHRHGISPAAGQSSNRAEAQTTAATTEAKANRSDGQRILCLRSGLPDDVTLQLQQTQTGDDECRSAKLND